jgi:hypothetical protein
MSSIQFDIRKILLFTGLSSLIFIILGAITAYYLVHLRLNFLPKTLVIFNLNMENNIPTWYASFVFLICSASAWLISISNEHSHDRFQWKIIATIFLLMSLDEGASLHEYVGGVIKGFARFEGNLYFAWVVPAMIIIPFGALYFFRFWLRLSLKYRLILALAAIIYFGGAVGMEIIAGSLYENGQSKSMSYVSLTVIEESMELSGQWLFLFTLLHILAESKFNRTIAILKSREEV